MDDRVKDLCDKHGVDFDKLYEHLENASQWNTSAVFTPAECAVIADALYLYGIQLIERKYV